MSNYKLTKNTGRAMAQNKIAMLRIKALLSLILPEERARMLRDAKNAESRHKKILGNDY